MKHIEVPADVMANIRKAAKRDWDSDAAMIRYCIDAEVDAYRSLHHMEFGQAAPVKQQILDGATRAADSWEERLSIIESEIEAYQELQAGFDDVPEKLVPSSHRYDRAGLRRAPGRSEAENLATGRPSAVGLGASPRAPVSPNPFAGSRPVRVTILRARQGALERNTKAGRRFAVSAAAPSSGEGDGRAQTKQAYGYRDQ